MKKTHYPRFRFKAKSLCGKDMSKDFQVFDTDELVQDFLRAGFEKKCFACIRALRASGSIIHVDDTATLYY